MKRHVSLRQLSVDHHHALVQARRLLRAADSDTRAEVVAAFLRFAARDLWPHFEAEERVLLPEYARADERHEALAGPALLDHVALRAAVLDLERGAPDAAAVKALAERLERHVRFEERKLFPAIERALSPERMAAVGVLLSSGGQGRG